MAEILAQIREVKAEVRALKQSFDKHSASNDAQATHSARLEELRARKSELKRQLPPIPSYENFTRGIREDGRARDRAAQWKAATLLSQIKIAKRGHNSDAQTLRARLAELRSQAAAEREQRRAVLDGVRSELKALRRARKSGEEATISSREFPIHGRSG